MNNRPIALAFAAGLYTAAAAPAFAQTDPKFEFAKPEEVTAVEWKASAQAGMIVTTGNSKSTTIAAGAKASRKDDGNKFQLEGGLVFARSTIFIAADGNGNGTIDLAEIDERSQTTSQAWLVKARYDRFLTDHNSLFLTGIASGDEPAGKDFVGGGQAGYSRLVYKTDEHEVTGEAGYDFSYEKFAAGDSISIHSLRSFAAYAGKLSADTGVAAELEALFNLNSLDTAGGEVGAFEDVRLNMKAGLTTKLWQDLSFSFSVKARFDNAPAPRKPFDLPYTDPLLAEEWDTTTEASLIYNFL
jgi:hypothetical protein